MEDFGFGLASKIAKLELRQVQMLRAIAALNYTLTASSRDIEELLKRISALDKLG